MLAARPMKSPVVFWGRERAIGRTIIRPFVRAWACSPGHMKYTILSRALKYPSGGPSANRPTGREMRKDIKHATEQSGNLSTFRLDDLAATAVYYARDREVDLSLHRE